MQGIVLPQDLFHDLVERLLDVVPNYDVSTVELVLCALVAGKAVPVDAPISTDAVYELVWMTDHILSRLQTLNLITPNRKRRLVIVPRQTWYLLVEDK